jgi:hypothetical protein
MPCEFTQQRATRTRRRYCEPHGQRASSKYSASLPCRPCVCAVSASRYSARVIVQPSVRTRSFQRREGPRTCSALALSCESTVGGGVAGGGATNTTSATTLRNSPVTCHAISESAGAVRTTLHLQRRLCRPQVRPAPFTSTDCTIGMPHQRIGGGSGMLRWPVPLPLLQGLVRRLVQLLDINVAQPTQLAPHPFRRPVREPISRFLARAAARQFAARIVQCQAHQPSRHPTRH